MGLSGGISRAASEHPGAFDADQLYSLKEDPEEQVNLADRPAHQEQLRAMQEMLRETLSRFRDRPYGEFVAGGNTAPRAGSLDVLRQLREFHNSFEKKPPRRNSGR